MTTVIDIHCPACESPANVVKEGLDSYRCTECDRTFSIDEFVG